MNSTHDGLGLEDTLPGHYVKRLEPTPGANFFKMHCACGAELGNGMRPKKDGTAGRTAKRDWFGHLQSIQQGGDVVEIGRRKVRDSWERIVVTSSQNAFDLGFVLPKRWETWGPSHFLKFPWAVAQVKDNGTSVLKWAYRSREDAVKSAHEFLTREERDGRDVEYENVEFQGISITKPPAQHVADLLDHIDAADPTNLVEVEAAIEFGAEFMKLIPIIQAKYEQLLQQRAVILERTTSRLAS